MQQFIEEGAPIIFAAERKGIATPRSSRRDHACYDATDVGTGSHHGDDLPFHFALYVALLRCDGDHSGKKVT